MAISTVSATDAELALTTSVLGGTEGSYYINAAGKLVDIRYVGTVSTNASGLSFGLTQLDVANNGLAKSLFKQGLANAVRNGDISQATANNFLQRASIKGLKTSGQNFTPEQMAVINKDVLATIIPQINAADQKIVRQDANFAANVIAAIKAKWGSAGALDPSSPDYDDAYGNLISWINRTGKPTTLGNYLAGGKPPKLGGGTPPQVTGPPSLQTLKNYLMDTKQFNHSNKQWNGLQGNIKRGLNLLRNPSVLAKLMQRQPGGWPAQAQGLVDVGKAIAKSSPASQLPGILSALQTAAALISKNGNKAKAYFNNNDDALIATAKSLGGVKVAVENVSGHVLINGRPNGVTLPTGGTLANGGWTIKGTQNGVAAGGPATIVNEGTMQGGTSGAGVALAATGRILNSGKISGGQGLSAGERGSLTNTGTVRGTKGTGVSFGQGSLDNRAGGKIVGAVNGVVLNGGKGSVTDAGTIIGTTGTGVTENGGGAVTLQTSGSVIKGGEDGIDAGDNTTVTNDGSITGTKVDAVVIGSGTVTNEGKISGDNGVDIAGKGTIDNTDSIAATGGAAADIGGGGAVTNGDGDTITGAVNGVIISGGAGNVTDSGSIIGTSGTGVEDESGGTVDIAGGATVKGGENGIDAGGDTIVTNDGSITGTKVDAVVIGSGTVTNEGKISGDNGVDIAGKGTIDNTDSITATGGAAADIGGGGAVTNGEGDTITGAVNGVIISGGAGNVTDSGSIIGTSGTGVEDESGGKIALETSGTVIKGGEDGIDAGDNTTLTNDGSITGTKVDAVVIGSGTVTNEGKISGDNGVDIAGKGTIDNTDSITATGGAAADIGGGGAVTNGDGDTITGAVNGVIISGGAGNVTDSGSIIGTSGTGVEDESGGKIALETSGTVIKGGEDGIDAGGDTIVTNDGSITGTKVDAVVIGSGTVTNEGKISGDNGVDIAGKGTIDNTDSITATGGAAADIGGGGAVTNGDGDTITGAVNGVIISGGAGNVTDSGSIIGTSGTGVEDESGGKIALETSGTVIKGGEDGIDAGDNTTLTNDGSITGTKVDAVVIGSGTVTNEGKISGDNGVDIAGKGTIDNTDSITATGGAAADIGGGGAVTNGEGDTITGAVNGVIISGGAGNVTDSGSIIGTSGTGVEDESGGKIALETSGTVIKGGEDGIDAGGDTIVTNDGSITGTKVVGVVIGGSAGSLVNDGSITGSIGVEIDGAGTDFTNDGTITGTGPAGIAVELAGGDTITLDGGGSFDGLVEGLNGVDDDTLDLSGDGGSGDLSDLGDGLDAFSSVNVDDGADWTLDGDNSIDSFSDDGDVDIGDIVGGLALRGGALAARAQLQSGGSLTITGALGGSGTLNLSSGASLEIGGTATGNGIIAFTTGAKSETVKLDTATTISERIKNFALGDAIDLASLAFAASFEVKWRVTAKGGTLEIIDTAQGDEVEASLAFLGGYSGEMFTLKSDGASGTTISLVASPFRAPAAGDVLFTDVNGAAYSAYEQDYASGSLVDTIYDYNVGGAIDGETYDAKQIEKSPGGALMATTYYLANGGHVIVGAGNGLTLTSILDDTMTGGGSADTFVFNAGFGQDSITDFASHETGANHDFISLPLGEFATVGAIESATTFSGGNAIIKSGGDVLTIDGVTSWSKALARDFLLHG